MTTKVRLGWGLNWRSASPKFESTESQQSSRGSSLPRHRFLSRLRFRCLVLISSWRFRHPGVDASEQDEVDDPEHHLCIVRIVAHLILLRIAVNLDLEGHVASFLLLEIHDIDAESRPTSVYVQAVFFIEDEPLFIHIVGMKTQFDLLYLSF